MTRRAPGRPADADGCALAAPARGLAGFVHALSSPARGLAALALAASALVPAGASAQSFAPVPIGAGPEYVPAARWPLAGGAAYGGFGGRVDSPTRVHLELFANRQVVVVPGGIGVAGGRTERYGFVTDALWTARAWTLQPGGVIQLATPGMRLGEFFHTWGEPVGEDRLLGWTGQVRAFVNGAEAQGDPAGIQLHDRDQVVLMIGGYTRPHPSFTFTPRRDI